MFSATPDHHPHTSLSPPLLPLPPNLERKWKLHLETAPNCPRCASSNTKFCYYNNYSFSQPRYFCKSCRRYWTKGGSLRNVPIGGGSRKTRRSNSTRSTSLLTSNPVKSDGSHSATSPDSIDLAAVFARFLDPPSHSNPTTDSLDPLDGLISHNSEFSFEGLSDLLLNEDTHQVEESAETANRPFGFGSETGSDEVWTDAMGQFEDMDYCLASNYNGDQLRVSDEYCEVGDNWSSMDFASGFEVFSTP